MPFASPRVGCSISLVGPGELPCRWPSPPSIVPHLCGATLLAIHGTTLLAIQKKGRLRPIGVGEVLRQLTSKCLSRAIQHATSFTLCPLQLGVGIRSGCESIVHAVAHLMEDSDIPPDERWELQLDFSNAFNS